MKRGLVFVLGVLVIAGFFGYRFVAQNFAVHVPVYPAPAKTVWLDQNWSDAERRWFHAADQGTLTFGIPYEWLMALEQPEITLGAAPPLTDAAYLDRFGFIAGAPGELPVGFAHGGPMPLPDGTPWLNPQTKTPLAGVGLTCAACHTGRFTYQGTQVLVDGAPALTNLDSFRTGLGLSLVFTSILPGRTTGLPLMCLVPSQARRRKKPCRRNSMRCWRGSMRSTRSTTMCRSRVSRGVWPARCVEPHRQHGVRAGYAQTGKLCRHIGPRAFSAYLERFLVRLGAV